MNTNTAAFNSMSDTTTARLRKLVFHTIRETQGATCDEIEQITELSHQTCSPRVHELMKSGDIVDSGERRATRSGRKAIVWKVAA